MTRILHLISSKMPGYQFIAVNNTFQALDIGSKLFEIDISITVVAVSDFYLSKIFPSFLNLQRHSSTTLISLWNHKRSPRNFERALASEAEEREVLLMVSKDIVPTNGNYNKTRGTFSLVHRAKSSYADTTHGGQGMSGSINTGDSIDHAIEQSLKKYYQQQLQDELGRGDSTSRTFIK